tara:strand:+ start:193 stop:447 length:255 start_codon:yes stop_codon:yes gene_type:complete
LLILSRRENESIIIDGNISITVVDIGDGRVRIGIDAPSEMEIHRKEVHDRIKNETKVAAIASNRLKEIEKLTPPKKLKNQKKNK